jgi:inosine-uridine nucleoside N-ribohydrolase
LFGDFGIDDTIALLFLLFSKEVEIIGIVADYGNYERTGTQQRFLLNYQESKAKEYTN